MNNFEVLLIYCRKELNSSCFENAVNQLLGHTQMHSSIAPYLRHKQRGKFNTRSPKAARMKRVGYICISSRVSTRNNKSALS